MKGVPDTSGDHTVGVVSEEEDNTSAKKQHFDDSMNTLSLLVPDDDDHDQTSLEQRRPGTVQSPFDKSFLDILDGDSILDRSDVASSDASSSSSKNYFSKNHQHGNTDQERLLRFARLSLCGMLVIGTLASSLLIVVGTSNARKVQYKAFENSASHFAREVQAAFHDYELAGLWVQQETSRILDLELEQQQEKGDETTRREDFRSLYLDLVSSGLEFQVTSYNPNVTGWQERQQLERDSREWYHEHYPTLEYEGIRGLELNGNDENSTSVRSRSIQDFYFPVHYLEPIEGNEDAIDFDLYSSSSRRQTIQRALETYQPALTPRLHLVQETDPSAYSVILMHPGIPKENSRESNYTVPSNSLSSIVLRMPDLLKRAASLAREEALSVHIFDSFSDHFEDSIHQRQFLGGATISPQGNIRGTAATLTSLPNVRLDDLRSDDTISLMYEEHLEIVSGQFWRVVVSSTDQEFDAKLDTIILAGAFLMILCLSVGFFLFISFRRIHHQNIIKTKSDLEKAEWMIRTAKGAARVERELNDFIAHEVRNPLSAAISACSFVSSSIEAAPLVSDATGKDQKEFIQDDLQIIESNLHFMNDLLRNMLDIHQAHSKQLQISMKPTHLMNDVLRPVDSLLHRRSTGVRVELEAVPPDLMVLTDPLRLKQILSNLATNSMRFVSANEHSLIRIRAYVDETSKKVQVSVEDNGPGIPLEKRRESLFFRFQTSLDTLNQGTGIGLNLCKKVIELMGGNISLDDDYDTGSPDWPGTRFVLDLRQSPLDESQLLLLFDDTSGTISHSQEPARMTRDDTNAKPTLTIQQDFLVLSKDNEKPSSPDHSFIIDSHRTATTIESENMESDDSILPENLSVLFVDDDTILRKLFLRCVKKVAPTWKIQEAANGESALSIVEEQDASSGGGIDLIFLDQYMASVQKQLLGTETALALRSKGFNSLICGLSANDVASLFEEAGADCFLCKPFPCKPVELKTELLRILKCRRFKLE